MSKITDQNLSKSDLEQTVSKLFNVYFYAHRRISNNIGHFVTFEKSKTTCPFDGNEAAKLPYLAALYQD